MSASSQSEPTIRVHVQFPNKIFPIDEDKYVPGGAAAWQEFLDPSHWRWNYCLSFPVHKIARLHVAEKPYKWIQYATGAVAGAEGELHTSADPDSELVDSSVSMAQLVDSTSNSVDLYYHTTLAEKRRMFPTDPHLCSPRTSRYTVSTQSETCSAFDYLVTQRDSALCVAATPNTLDYCRPAHIIPYRKGSAYMETFCVKRARCEEDIVYHVNDSRNGLFLDRNMQASMGRDFAFLPTPNFAMTTTDVDPTAPPDELRYTTHYFAAPNKQSIPYTEILDTLRRPPAEETISWPISILFDALYASAVMRHFSGPDLEKASQVWMDTMRKDVSMIHEMAERKREPQRKAWREERQREREEEYRNSVVGRMEAVGWTHIRMLIFVPPEQLLAALEEREKEIEAEKQRKLAEKVEAWRDTTLEA